MNRKKHSTSIHFRFIKQERELSKKNKKQTKTKSSTLIYRGVEGLRHAECRELERYNTSCLNHKQVLQDVRKGFYIHIKSYTESIEVLVRYSSHYYVIVIDKKLRFIKTLLPTTSCDFDSLVEQYVKKFSKVASV